MKSAITTSLGNILGQNNIIEQLYNKIKDLMYALRYDKKAQSIIGGIVSINLFFIFLHFFVRLLAHSGMFEELILALHLDSSRFRLDRDLGFAEWFNYMQTIMCAWLLLGVSRATRQPLYGAWALIFLFVVLDDSLKIHEKLGSYIVGAFDIPALPGLRPQDSGELLVWAVIGSVLLGILWRGFARSGRSARAAGGVLALAFAALIFFAIGIDMAHVAFSGPSTVASALLAVLSRRRRRDVEHRSGLRAGSAVVSPPCHRGLTVTRAKVTFL